MDRRSRGFFVAGLFAGSLGLLFAYAGDAAALSKDDAKCVNAMNKNLAKVASTMGKDVSACIKNFGKQKLTGTAEDCLSADVKGKVAKAAGKTGSDFTKKCASLPAFGVTDPNTVNQVAIEKELFLVRDIFGSDLDLNLSTEKDPSKCQQAVIKSVLKCQDARMKSYNSCKKNALKAAHVTDPSELAACIGDDGKGKISKACGKISGDVTKKCSGQDLETLFPGCLVPTTGELTTCLEDAADCRSCAAIKLADGLDATCSACIPSGPLGTVNCVYDKRAWCGGGDRDGEPCTDVLGNSDCPGGGNCLSISQVFVSNIAAQPLFDIPTGGQFNATIGTPDPITGLASIECVLIRSDPLELGPLIGTACVKPADSPIPGCPVAGQIDCDGGTPMELRHENYHDIADCGLGDDPNETDPNNLTGPSACAALCDAHCAGLTHGNFSRLTSGCEGYCREGFRDGLTCTNDVDCVRPNPNFPNDPRPFDLADSGDCVGGEPVAHRNRCQCECEEIGGVRSRPGDYYCWQHFATTVESNSPCDELDTTSFSLSCNDRGSMRLLGTIFDVNAVEGASFSAGMEGEAPNCRQMAQNNLGSLALAGLSMTQDGGLGDQISATKVVCRGPGYDLGP